jgi:FKBP-type peptidyl-prolyl cis-trans isomerase
MSRSIRPAALAVLVVFPVLLASCLDTDISVPDAVPIERTVFAASLGVDLAASTRTPNGAYYRDIVVGSGPAIASGDSIAVNYTGWLSDGTKFDASISGTPLEFRFGVGRVIPGMDETLVGARVGGQRQLIIPPSLAYGPYGAGPIPGNTVIVFKVEIVAVR